MFGHLPTLARAAARAPARPAAVALAALLAATPARAAFLIDPTGTGPAGGVDGFFVQPLGGPPPPPPILVTVPLGPNLTKREKGEAIAKALGANGVAATLLAGGTVRVAAAEVIWNSGTNEPNDGILSESVVNWGAALGFSGQVTGRDGQGQPAVGAAGFAFDGLTASADLAAAGGPGTPTDVWLSNVYLDIRADLPPDLRPFLTLDPAAGLIAYRPPARSFEPRVFAGTTDAGLRSRVGMSARPVPAPPGAALAAAGGACLFGRRLRRRA